jgi:energy-coupling factor transporter ATP-binding protein EcfA2
LYITKLFENDNADTNNVNDNNEDDGGSNKNDNNCNKENSINVNTKNMNDSQSVLTYLTQKRGINRTTLRKYGVGCARYNFPDRSNSKSNSNNNNNKTGGSISYVSSVCVTFPWMMRMGEVEEMEDMRGAKYTWKTNTTTTATATTNTPQTEDVLRTNNEVIDVVDDGYSVDTSALRHTSTLMDKKKEKDTIAKMTALERYHYRKERKNRSRNRIETSKSNQSQMFGAKSGHNINDDDGGMKVESLDNNKDEEEDEEEEEEEEESNVESLHGPYITRRIKVRSIEHKVWQRLDPPGGGSGLFGWHTIPSNANSIIITEGEFDAMAVYQATGRPTVSLPNGCRSFPTDIIALLERFDTVYVWMDNDGPGQEGAEIFAKKLGVERCLIVRPSGKRGWISSDRQTPSNIGNNDNDATALSSLSSASSSEPSPSPPPSPPKDANEALLQGWDLNELLEEASELPHERILKFSDLRDQVIHEIINPDKYRGTPVTSLPGFTSLIKGFRRGEMTVLTGPTGSGKTTFLGQISLDLAEQGTNVLWGSFEIKNTRLMHKLLQQYMRDVLPMGLATRDNLSEIEKQQQLSSLMALADKFESLPMHFLKFHGGSDVDHVLDAMEYAAYVYDVDHIILDNMQFMISRTASQAKKGGGSAYDKFDMQDVAIEKFRKFATDYNVHVSLVVHPRKEDENVKLGISSFYGSAKATQEADTVLILQSDGKRKFVDVRKNRFDGTLGHVPLYFDRKSGRYTETDTNVASPPRTSVPQGVSAMGGVSSVKATYNDIRNQHPL